MTCCIVTGMVLDRILLGLLREPRSGYDLKAAFRRGAAHVWDAELSQIYRTLQRMERAGWVRSRVHAPARGPARRVYRRTAKGREALLDWLAAEPDMSPTRLAYLAQLFFMAEGGDTASFLRALRERFHARLEELRGIARVLDDDTDHGMHQRLTLDLGLAVARARVRWCDAAIAKTEVPA